MNVIPIQIKIEEIYGDEECNSDEEGKIDNLHGEEYSLNSSQSSEPALTNSFLTVSKFAEASYPENLKKHSYPFKGKFSSHLLLLNVKRVITQSLHL